MSYEAVGKGYVRFKEGSDVKKIQEYIENNNAGMFESQRFYSDEMIVEISTDGRRNYYSENLPEYFDGLMAAGQVEESSIDFIGEDNQYWRMEYRNGKWEELNGEVYYKTVDEPSVAQIRQMFIDYVTNDLEGSDPEYVSRALAQVGCTPKMQKALGLDMPEEPVAEEPTAGDTDDIDL